MVYRISPNDLPDVTELFSGVEQSCKNVGTCCIRDARRPNSGAITAGSGNLSANQFGATGAERITWVHPSLFRLAHALIPRMTPGQLPAAAWRGAHQEAAPAAHALERDHLHNW
jgi:hypothetical protein